jgi:hypothetical protein
MISENLKRHDDETIGEAKRAREREGEINHKRSDVNDPKDELD